MLQQAAMISRIFGLDPVHVLDESDHVRHAVRVAATQYVIEQENEANRKGAGK